MLNRIKNWLEIRIGLEALLRAQFKEYRVPKNINMFYTLGFVATAGFLMQIITGFFLLIYYIPHSEHAFRSVQDIMNKVPYGWLFRLMHTVGSNLVVTVLFLHMISVFFMGSYKKPREMTWISGWFMLIIALSFCLSGYLLPWSQLSFWATTIVTNIPTAFPYMGDFMARVLRGGDSVSGITLNRFFALHVTFLPLMLIFFMVIHFFLIRRIGVSAPQSGRTVEKRRWTEYRHEDHPDGYPFYPYFVLRDMSMVMVYLATMFFIIGFMPALFLPEDANTPADPFKTPFHIKPEWYFLAPYQMLKIIPNKLLGITAQILITGIFIMWPFFDTKEERNILSRPLLLSVFFLSILIWFGLTIWGAYS